MARACRSLVPGTNAMEEKPCRESKRAMWMVMTLGVVANDSSTSTSLLEPRCSSCTSSYSLLETRRGRKIHFRRCCDQRMASWMQYPGAVAPRALRIISYCLVQLILVSSPLGLRWLIHRLFLFLMVPSGRVYSFPMDPMMRSPFFSVAHSHFMPLSVSPSPSVITKRGTTNEWVPSFELSISKTVPVRSSKVKRRSLYSVNSDSSIPRPASLCFDVRVLVLSC
mmetsp:Transcript_12127/g.17423  ORF Transcript_12127/g.17423 Transcript_12127/m.17423 type:complete len:224 (+) Transcript_12127:243-914(+)